MGRAAAAERGEGLTGRRSQSRLKGSSRNETSRVLGTHYAD
jgi:hypothetical protein